MEGLTKATNIVMLPVEKIVPADWNYKQEGSKERKEKLGKSIKHDGSAGVPAVRELDDGTYEMIDGNHRLAQIVGGGFKKIPCENFGKISKAKAITIARRRNFQWFDDDVLKLSELFRDFVMPEFTMEELSEFMPESQAELAEIANLFAYNKKQFEGKDKEKHRLIVLSVDEDAFTLWERWQTIAKKDHGAKSEAEAFKVAMNKVVSIK
jgi:hypothetical protein